jgi:DNA helicase-2/ATP-dependent DNA helicase PcrA
VDDLRTKSPVASAEALLEGLNAPQQEAVSYGDGPLLVLAGAGSGKTRALTHRIAWLLATGRARPDEILAITFTNKAAQEMRDRVGAMVGAVERRMWVMTFHAACARLLRVEAEKLGYKSSYTIYDEADARRMIKRVLDAMEVDTKRYPPRAIKARISDAKNSLIGPSEYASEADSPFEELVAQAYAQYRDRMLEANAMDFDDLLVNAVSVLERDQEVLARYRQKFRWILVDEYQDTNRAQYRLLQLLASESGNITVVGDDSQAIYGFRGSDVRNILEFERDFPGAAVVKLEQNYRSTQNILGAANAVIANNPENLEKVLWSEAPDGEPIKVVTLDDEHAEARYVAGEIESLVESGTPRDEIAVFYRVNAQSRVLEDVLVRYEMPYQVVGGTKFYERAEIKDAIGYLTLLNNPADQMAFSRVVNSPKRGIGQTSQARLFAYSNTTGRSIWEVACDAPEVPGLGAAAVRSLGRFTEMLEELREGLEDRPVADLLEDVLGRTDYLETLRAERTIEAEGRVENLEELIGVAREFDANRRPGETESATPALEEFLQEVSLYTDQDGLSEDEGKVTLMTLHNAKGLEYEAAFVIGCEEGTFPHSRALEEGSEGEERRLCYVGITRARRSLWMTNARTRRLYGGRSEPTIPSRFLDELPEQLLEVEGERSRSSSGVFGGWASETQSRPQPLVDVPSFTVGDDVVHESFGEGVITGVEPGGVVTVRFAGEGTERKLMADYAPMSLARAS